jgi:hypothetical protein
MSGGAFDYSHSKMRDTADEIEEIVRQGAYGYSQSTIDKFQQAIIVLRRAAVYAQRIDWLVSGDDGEDTFHQRLEAELKICQEPKA